MKPCSLFTVAFALAGTLSCQEYAEQPLTPGQEKKVAAHILSDVPKPQHEVGAIIEDQVRLIGYDIDKTQVKAGEEFVVTYYVEALSEVMADNMVFVHFQGRKNDRRAWMNLDHHLVEGLLPLRKLKKGQIVKDVQRIRVKPEFPSGTATVYWGLWRGQHRLKISNAAEVPHDKEGRVIISKVRVQGTDKKAGLKTAFASQLKPEEAITIDGKLDEAVWQRARKTHWWVSPDGSDRKVPKTRAQFSWDKDKLYVAVVSEDTDVWSTFEKRDSNTWEQEVIELFIDADGDKKNYLELQVTPKNTIFDALFVKHRSDLAKARAWNMKGFETAVHVDGTLNQRGDTDRGYTVEMAIPFSEVPGASATPAPGSHWRVNLFRWDFPKGQRQQAAAFSAPIVGDFHALDRFGKLVFTTGTPTGKRPRLDPNLIKSPSMKLQPKPTSGQIPGTGKKGKSVAPQTP